MNEMAVTRPLAPAASGRTRPGRVAGAVLMAVGVVLLGAAAVGRLPASGWTAFALVFGTFGVGAIAHIVATYVGTPPGIQNDGVQFNGAQTRGFAGWLLGLAFTTFYCLLYWKGELLGGMVALVEPLSRMLRGAPADHWFLYGFVYTYAIVFMGVRFAYRYRHVRYQLVRTASVVFFQLGFAFLIPAFLRLMQQPEFYFTYFWPLKYDYLFPGTIADLTKSGASLGVFMVTWGVVAAFVATPILTYYFGKRWYCSWVCGCGGLAETAGDPFRHLSSKKLSAWKFERWSIHLVLVAIVLCTALLWTNSALGGDVLGRFSQGYASVYGFVVGAALSGVVGVGFYPLLGSRVWCRFFCPQAAILGLFQRFFSRFRITTNGGQCISCGNCSTYCEMGIDVRAYAQRGANVVRASCVGCGICAAVCPRGVLKLENGPTHGDRFEHSGKPLKALLESLRARS